MVQSDEDLPARLDYNSHVFEAATLQRMLGDLQSLLEGIVSEPGQRISELPLQTEAERPTHLARSWSTRFRKLLRRGLRRSRRGAGKFLRAGQDWPLVGHLFARIEGVSGRLLPPTVTEPFRVPSAVLNRSLDQTQADASRDE